MKPTTKAAAKKGRMTPEELEIVRKGMWSANLIVCSPIEWSWTQKEQENMARCILILNGVVNDVVPPYTREKCGHRKKYCRSELCKKCYDRLAQKHRRYVSSKAA